MLGRQFVFTSLIAAASVAFVAGCGSEKAPPIAGSPSSPSTAAETAEAHAHGHGSGPHDGTLADWGGGKYHVEFTVDHDKQEATVYVLGDDEKSPSPIKADKVLLTIVDPSIQVDLLPVPLEGESDGASRFVGKHEGLGTVQEFQGTISGEIEGTPFAGDFKEEPHGDHAH
jgi:hypothetical protein